MGMRAPVTIFMGEPGTKAVDRDEIRRALAILIDPNQTFELRGMPYVRSKACRGDNIDEAIEAAHDLSNGVGVYYTLNTCRHYLDKAAADGDNVSRRWMLVDVDVERPNDTNSTDAEKAAAGEVIFAILECLEGLGWPGPVMIDSGNGWHLLYRIDLPNTKLAQQLVKAVLVELASRFDNDKAKVDRAVHNASRISKLPGTWARKGPHSDERPHRMSRLLAAPNPVEVVTAEQMEAFVRKEEKPLPEKPTLKGHTFQPATNGSLDRWVRKAIENECYSVICAKAGPAEGRNNRLNKAAYTLGGMAAWPEMQEVAARAELFRAAILSGLGERESLGTIESGWDKGAAAPRDRPEEKAYRNGTAHANGHVNGKPEIAPGGLIIWAKNVKVRKVDWLWPGRIPVGKQTTFAGQTGMGKTFTLCDIAARVTNGAEIPYGGGECFQQGKVLIISAEDDADDTIVPRFAELGGDLSRLAFLSPESEDQFSLAALELLSRSLDQMGEDVRMVAIDPPTSYLGKVDDHKNAELRGLLAPLRRWSIQRNVARGVRHPRQQGLGPKRGRDGPGHGLGGVGVGRAGGPHVLSRPRQQGAVPLHAAQDQQRQEAQGAELPDRGDARRPGGHQVDRRGRDVGRRGHEQQGNEEAPLQGCQGLADRHVYSAKGMALRPVLGRAPFRRDHRVRLQADPGSDGNTEGQTSCAAERRRHLRLVGPP